MNRGYHEIKEHGKREFPFNIYPCSIPVDFSHVALHWHEEMEIIAVKKGKGRITGIQCLILWRKETFWLFFRDNFMRSPVGMVREWSTKISFSAFLC